jgi:hypothetical protein
MLNSYFLVGSWVLSHRRLPAEWSLTAKRPLPNGLFEQVDNILDFELEHKSRYFTYLVANSNIARVFMKLSLLYKISWVTTFLNKKC